MKVGRLGANTEKVNKAICGTWGAGTGIRVGTDLGCDGGVEEISVKKDCV